jgi:hypothetical protein
MKSLSFVLFLWRVQTDTLQVGHTGDEELAFRYLDWFTGHLLYSYARAAVLFVTMKFITLLGFF